jgi:hypothetical protein
MAKKYVLCRKCGTRNDRTGGRRKCSNVLCGAALPKRRVPKHALTLRDQTYADYVQINAAIHAPQTIKAGAFRFSFAFDPEECGVCGRPKPETRRHDRDHDHRTGLARGLACVRCNHELLRNSTLEEARAVVAYLERVEQYYREAS